MQLSNYIATKGTEMPTMRQLRYFLTGLRDASMKIVLIINNNGHT